MPRVFLFFRIQTRSQLLRYDFRGPAMRERPSSTWEGPGNRLAHAGPFLFALGELRPLLRVLRHEQPVTIRVPPKVCHVVPQRGRPADIEARVEQLDARQDVPVHAFLGDGALAPFPTAFRLLLVLVVQTELDRAQYHVHALQQDVALRIDFGDVPGIQVDPGTPEFRRAIERRQIGLEPRAFLQGVRQLVEHQPNGSALSGNTRVTQAEGMFDELVIQDEESVLALFRAQPARREVVLREHDPELDVALRDEIEQLVHQGDVLVRIGGRYFLPLHLVVQAQGGATCIEARFHRRLPGRVHQQPAIEIAEVFARDIGFVAVDHHLPAALAIRHHAVVSTRAISSGVRPYSS